MEARVRMICEALGPTFIKLGQLLATRPDIASPRLVLELSRLQDNVPPGDFDAVRAIVEEDLGGSLAELFESFDEEAMAAASIAQVHGAVLKDGRRVVAKVQRPGLLEIIETDLDILVGLAELAEEYVEELRPLRPRAIAEEFSVALHQEVDFSHELDNLQRYRRLFSDSDLAVVPAAIPELCSSRVITMERMEGFKITDAEALRLSGLDATEIARAGMLVMLQSIFEHGFFHADPHPGNFLVREDGVLCVLDFGLMGEIDGRRIDELLGFLVAVLLEDVDMLIAQLQEMEILDDSREPRRLRRELSVLLRRFHGVKLGDLSAADVISKVFDAVRGEAVTLPMDLLLVAKSVGTVEGIAAEICPDFEPLEELRPFLLSVYTKRALDPRSQSRALARTMGDTVSLLRTLPRDLRAAMRRLNRGDLVVQTRAADGDVDRAQRDRAVNRVALTLVLCTSMVLTTLLIYYPPAEAGTPWGALAAGVFTFGLFVVLAWSIVRSRGL